jgi:hypothetical protein
VVAVRLGIDPDTVGQWRRRFTEHRLEGLWDEPRSGTPRTIEDARIEAVIVRALETVKIWFSRCLRSAGQFSILAKSPSHSTPPLEFARHGAGQWAVSLNSTADVRAFGLQPHRLETSKLSTDPDFVAKVRDVVGLYIAPPERAVVLYVDEKSQIQALDRSH